MVFLLSFNFLVSNAVIADINSSANSSNTNSNIVPDVLFIECLESYSGYWDSNTSQCYLEEPDSTSSAIPTTTECGNEVINVQVSNGDDDCYAAYFNSETNELYFPYIYDEIEEQFYTNVYFQLKTTDEIYFELSKMENDHANNCTDKYLAPLVRDKLFIESYYFDGEAINEAYEFTFTSSQLKF